MLRRLVALGLTMALLAGLGAAASGVAQAAARPRPRAAAATAAIVPGTGATTSVQVDAAHDGRLDDGVEIPPLQEAWSIDLGDPACSPLIADGKVFVATAVWVDGDLVGDQVEAIGSTTGDVAWGPVSVGGNGYLAGLTYGDGMLFSVDDSGLMQALAADTGTQRWSLQLPGVYTEAAVPTFYDGAVYTDGATDDGSVVFAVQASGGTLLWSQGEGIGTGGASSPAVADDGVYLDFACHAASRLNRLTGAVIWYRSDQCNGGAGYTPVLNSGTDWIEDQPEALDRATGSLLMSGDASYPPAFDGTRGFFDAGSSMSAVLTNSTLTNLWTFTGDGQLDTAPIVVNGYVYVGSSLGEVWAVGETTGVAVWSADVQANLAPDLPSYQVSSLAAGQGIVLATTTDYLVAYAPASPPSGPTAWGDDG